MASPLTTFYIVKYRSDFMALYAGGPLVYNGALLCKRTLEVLAGVLRWTIEEVKEVPDYDGSTPGFPLHEDGTGKLGLPEYYDQYVALMDNSKQGNTVQRIKKLWAELSNLLGKLE